jgi:hypothetical protein
MLVELFGVIEERGEVVDSECAVDGGAFPWPLIGDRGGEPGYGQVVCVRAYASLR